MKQIVALILIASCFIGCSGNSSPGLERLEQYMQAQANDGFSGAVLLVENDSVLFNQGYGWAVKSLNSRNGPNTVFPYGSIVKDYTRAVVLMLAVDSVLSLDDSLSKYFPDITVDKAGITISQLLQHRSGLHPYHDQNDEARSKWPDIPGDFRPMSREECLEYIFSQTLLFQPGTKFSYSNSGYTLLALIIEKVTGMKYDHVVRSRILRPSGMKSTDFYNSELWNPPDVAVGYGPAKYGRENSPLYWPRNPYPILGNGGMAGRLIDFYKGIRFTENLKLNNARYSELANSVESQQAGIPDGIISSAGGNDFGFVSVVFGNLNTNQFMIFASNNDQDGVEDIEMIGQILKLGIGFDLMSLRPSSDSVLPANEFDSAFAAYKPNWKMPDKPHWKRVSLLLDLLNAQDTTLIEDFLEANGAQEYVASKSKQEHVAFFGDLMRQVAPVTLAGAEYATPDVTLQLATADGNRKLIIYLTEDSRRLIRKIDLQ